MRKLFLYIVGGFFIFVGIVTFADSIGMGVFFFLLGGGMIYSAHSYEQSLKNMASPDAPIAPAAPPKESGTQISLGFGTSKKDLQKKNEELENEIKDLKALIPPEQFDLKAEQDKLDERKRLLERDAREAKAKITKLKNEIEKLDQAMVDRHVQIDEIDAQIKEKMKQVDYWDDEIALTEFGLYTPVYDFATSAEYRERLDSVRRKQKELVKNKTAAVYSTNFTLNGSASKGRSLMNDTLKQTLRSFNNECDVLIDKVKFSNVESIRNRIYKSYDSLNKLNKLNCLTITSEYLDLKLAELNLAYEYAQKKQEEKEAEKARREELREQAKLQKEIAEERKRLEKEREHYRRVLEIVEQQLVTDPTNPELLAKKAELLEQLGQIEKGIADVDYREANVRAGYVYIISNIGSFGEDIYKIGMTRRLDPMERVRELGDASVPFNFDVHALIFSDDAPGLENALHHAFENNRLNWVNNRREFYHIKLEEIERVVKENYDKVVEFKKIPEAQQYRESLKMKEQV